MSSNEISDLHLQSLQVSWDAYPFPEGNLNELDLDKVNDFIDKVNDGGRFNLKDRGIAGLEKLNLVSGDFPTNAAMILFSKKNLGYNVHVGRFKTPSLIIDDKIISGNLYDVVKETMQYILGHIKVAFEIAGTETQRSEIFEYPYLL